MSQPIAGTDFYRVKSIDKSGALTFSTVVKVISQPKTRITIFPNPVNNLKVSLQLEGISAGKYSVKILQLMNKKLLLLLSM